LRPLRPGRCQAPCSFRPRRSSRPRRFSPLMDSRACCVPHPTMRFTGFPRTDDACLRSRRASSPMPTLQSFSLPRSGPRVTARSCPPVVRRQRQLDSGALIRSEIRCAEDSWPSPDARCSPGLPCLEPHSIAFTSASARERATQKVRLGPAQARAGRVAESAMSASPRPEGHGSARTRGGGWIGRGITTAHAIPRVRDRLRRRRSDVLAGHFPQGRWSSSMVDPTAPRRIVGQSPARLARRRACRVSTRGVPGPSARRVPDTEVSVRVCSAAFPKGGWGRRRGSRCRWVEWAAVRHPGWGDRSTDPAHQRGGGGSSERRFPRIRPGARAPHCCDSPPSRTSGKDVLQVIFVRQRTIRGSPRRLAFGSLR
jgi:hypothetical protein